ncbi:MAG: ATP-dependent zinc metalloprotease FtsH [Pseudomonadota bacterium]|jgi:cell division protease FtsH
MSETLPTSAPPRWMNYLALALLLLALAWLIMRPPPLEPVQAVPYTQFKALVREGAMTEVSLRGKVAQGRLATPRPLGPQGALIQKVSTRLPDLGDDTLLPLLEEKGVTVSVEADDPQGGLLALAAVFLPWVLLFLFFYWVYQRTQRTLSGIGGAGDLKGFLEGAVKKAEVPEVNFEDVAGQDNAKREVAELVEYLRDPERFRRLGAEVPKGVLLMGAPGTGKTLLAKALAGEAGVPFYSISASEFIEIFVGVGASRVRRLFKAAKENAPAIVFIDELDSIGRTRGTGLGGGHDEREQTLNQILAELDGFTGREAVIVLAATNRPDILDPALLRPGRFDRHVTLELPDRKDRVAILRVHLRKIPVAGDVDLDRIAAGTPGFSGADLKNLVNEAAILAARDNEFQVRMKHFDEARDKILLGGVRSLVIQPDERHRLAVHEAGHTLVAHFLPHADPLYKVTIIPRGRALGGTHQLPETERHTLPEDYLFDRLAVILAGRAAEEAVLGNVSSGADDDIHQATQLARAMVGRWGMSREIGPVDLRESDEHPFLGLEIAQPRRYSEHAAQAVDEAVQALLKKAEETAREVIRAHRGELDQLVAALEEKETLVRSEIEACLGGRPGQRADEAAT